MKEFEEWLRTVCFQRPTKEAYDLARCAYKAGMLAAAEIADAGTELEKARMEKDAEISRLREELESCANFMRGMRFDKTIPSFVMDAINARLSMIEQALKEERDDS